MDKNRKNSDSWIFRRFMIRRTIEVGGDTFTLRGFTSIYERKLSVNQRILDSCDYRAVCIEETIYWSKL